MRIISLNCTCVSFTLGNTAYVYLIACSKDICFNLCADFVVCSVLKLKLFKIFFNGYSSLFKMTFFRFVG